MLKSNRAKTVNHTLTSNARIPLEKVPYTNVSLDEKFLLQESLSFLTCLPYELLLKVI